MAVINFLNKLEKVGNKQNQKIKNKIKQPWLKLWVPSEIHRPIPDSDR
jgi:hypothetical protein